MLPPEGRELGRVRYWQGQKLHAHDFNHIHAVEAQRRWWHNRALHNAYGVHEGFSATSQSGETAIIVDAGLAYDDAGRELILEKKCPVPVPNVTTDQSIVLFVRYREKVASPRPDVLERVGCTSPPQFVEFAWKRKDCCQSADGVPLAEVKFLKGRRSRVLLNPPAIRPLSRPLLASGSTVPGNTSWRLWAPQWASLHYTMRYGVETTIDTSAAGFTDAPCYFAWLEGPLWSPQTQQILPALYPSIAEQSLNSFVFRLALLRENVEVLAAMSWGTHGAYKVGPDEFPLFASRQKLYVTWVGCQENVSAPFLAILRRIPLFSVDLSRFETVLLKLNRL